MKSCVRNSKSALYRTASARRTHKTTPPTTTKKGKQRLQLQQKQQIKQQISNIVIKSKTF